MVGVDQKNQAETPHLQGHHLRIQLPTGKKSSLYSHEVVDAKNTTGGGDFSSTNTTQPRMEPPPIPLCHFLCHKFQGSNRTWWYHIHAYLCIYIYIPSQTGRIVYEKAAWQVCVDYTLVLLLGFRDSTGYLTQEGQLSSYACALLLNWSNLRS